MINDTQEDVACVSVLYTFTLTLKNPQDQITFNEPSIVVLTNCKYHFL